MAMAEVREGEEWRGKVGGMTDADLQEFLGGGVVCRLSCLDADGWPYTVPVWFEYSAGGFYVIPRERSVWARHIQQNPRVCLCIDEPAPTLRKVLVRGEARIVEEPNVGGKWVEIANRMSYRYLGEHGPDYLVPTLNEPRWLIFVQPQKLTTWQGVDWAQRYKHSQW
jgi:general stress protein 26